MIPAMKKLAAYGSTFVILASASGLAWASGVTIPNTFTSGTPAKAAEVNANFSAVKTAVDDNDARITGVINNTQAGTLKSAVDTNTANITALTATVGNSTSGVVADINNLKGNLTGGTCVTNNTSDKMVRVGPICVDQYLARLSGALGNCNLDGTNGAGTCDIVAESTATGTPIKADQITWAQAARACANAGKRLLTPGEWMMARAAGQLSEVVVENMEFVDAVDKGATPSDTTPLNVGHIGPRNAAGGAVQLFTDVPYTTQPGDTTVFGPSGGTWIGFRCAR